MKKILYYGGTILTMDRNAPRASALLTENGKILAVGDYDRLKDADATPFDLRGRTLMPAFVDGHSHMMGHGIDKLKNCDLTGCKSFDELLARIRDYRESRGLTHGESISCRGYDPAIMKEGAHPNADILDSLGFDNPIRCTHQSGHIAAFNTAAMKKAGILDGGFVCPEGGFAGRDESGRLNGYFEETARHALDGVFKSDDPERDMTEGALLAQELYIKQGFTTLQEGSGNGALQLSVLDRLATDGKLKIDLTAYMSSAPSASDMRRDALKKYGIDYKNRFKLGGVKMFLDGSPQARTAWLSSPYEGESEYRGYPIISDAEAEARIGAALDEGWQVLAHCNGDAASEQFINAYERAAGERGLLGKDLRPVMIHAQTVRCDQLDRMKDIGMMASFFIDHCYFWGDTHLKNLGDRGQRISPARQALLRGIPFSFHQDCPVTTPDMLRSVWCAVNRVTRDGVIIGADDRISVYDALIAATRGGAYTYFEEDRKGILGRGALADLVILDRDPTAVDPMEIRNIRVLSTIKEDRVIYESEDQK